MRQFIYDRALGCCEYCLIPEKLTLTTHHVDHIIAEKHGGQTQIENLAFSCSLCNQAKGSDIASFDISTGTITRLYHPRQDRWLEHFHLDKSNGMIHPLTAIGRVSINLLRINRPECLSVRHILVQINQILIPSP
jgi:hypothetical protein